MSTALRMTAMNHPIMLLLRLSPDSCTHSQLPLYCHKAEPVNCRKFPRAPLISPSLV